MSDGPAAGSRRLARIAPGGRAAVDVAIGAFVAGAVLVTLATIMHGGVTSSGAIALLVALAALCVALLARWRAPSIAWLAAIAGMYAATTLPIEQARASDPALVGVGSWLTWALPAGAGALLTLWLAAGYATRPDRRLDPLAVPVGAGLLAWFAVALVTTLAGALTGTRADPAFTIVDVAAAPIARFSLFVLVLVALGAGADVRAALGRARDAGVPAPGSAVKPPAAGEGPQHSLATRAERAWALGWATLRELIPGQAAVAEATIAAERTRLAGDLHATVLPSLRRAIADAEAGGDPDALARRLRAVDLELERLMADRWPVVLEAFGLVAALEDLAERIELDAQIAVEIDVATDADRGGDRPPRSVERAAWRVAQLAVDNAVRHAAPGVIRIGIAAAADRVELTVADDGRGFDPSAPGAIRPAARGLTDARRRAAEVGASVVVEPARPTGSVVRFAWRQRTG